MPSVRAIGLTLLLVLPALMNFVKLCKNFSLPHK